MKSAEELRTGPVVLTAPIAGRVRLFPPRVLCGELEIFEPHETIATVTGAGGTELVAAPARGFLFRAHVIDDAIVGEGAPLVDFSVTG